MIFWRAECPAMMKPDFHMHSTFSDGVFTPSRLVEHAVSMGIDCMAITDHDTFAGVDSLTSARLPVLPGVELSLRDMRGLHLLGYGTSRAEKLRNMVDELARSRVNRARLMLDKLADMGMPLEWDQLAAGCSGSVGRAHIARALVAAGYAATLAEVFDRYLGEDCPAYVAGERLSMAEALPLMRESGFVPVLAHPALLEKDDVTLRILLEHWQGLGLMGVEVYHPSMAGKGFGSLDRMARSMGLLVTGGSDFHRPDDGRHGEPGCTARWWINAEKDAAALWAAADRKNS